MRPSLRILLLNGLVRCGLILYHMLHSYVEGSERRNPCGQEDLRVANMPPHNNDTVVSMADKRRVGFFLLGFGQRLQAPPPPTYRRYHTPATNYIKPLPHIPCASATHKTKPIINTKAKRKDSTRPHVLAEVSLLNFDLCIHAQRQSIILERE